MMNDGGGGEATTGVSSSSSGGDARAALEGVDASGAGDDVAAPRFLELKLNTFTSERRLFAGAGAGDALTSGVVGAAGAASPGLVPKKQ
jgi:hypothetical protein